MKGPATDDEEAGDPSWKRLIASEGGLQVDLPSDTTRLDATVKTSVGSVKVQGFRAEHDGVVFLGTYSECPARLSVLEYVKVLDAPLDLWVPGAGRRKSLGERLLPVGGPRGPREKDFSLPSRKGGVKWIARRRWMERQGHFYQAIAVMPETQAASAHIARFLESLEPIPIAVDRRGLTPAWKRTRSKNDGFSALWPERFDDPLIRIVKTPTRSLAYSTSFVFQRGMGFAVTVIQHDPTALHHELSLAIDGTEALDDARDRFLADDHAELLAERPIDSGGRTGRELEARFTKIVSQEPESRRVPPGPGVGHVKARLHPAAGSRLFLVYVTTPPGQETHPGVDSFLDSFRLDEP